MYVELEELDKAFEIQKELIKLKPRSYMPYYLFAYMFLDKGDYENALKYFKVSAKKSDLLDIFHNIGCCYFYLGNYKEAQEYFGKIGEDYDREYRSSFNEALASFKLGEYDDTKKIADRLFEKIEKNSLSTVGGYEIAILYYILGDYNKASQALIKQGISGIYLPDWKELSYSLFVSNRKLWMKEYNRIIEQNILWIKEIEDGSDEWEFDSEDEKQVMLKKIKYEIDNISHEIAYGIKKVEVDFEKLIWIEPCPCLLFGCEKHKNLYDDGFNSLDAK